MAKLLTLTNRMIVMDKKQVQKEISQMIELMQHHHDLLCNTSIELQQIDVDLLLDSTRKLYQRILTLNKFIGTSEPLPVPAPPVVQSVVNIYTEPKTTVEANTNAVPVHHVPPVVTPPANVVPVEPQPKPEVKQEAVVEPKEPEVAKPAVVQEKAEIKPKASIVDQYASEPSLYDRLSQGHQDKSLASKLQQKPITDLKAAIGLNEKFTYIKKIFNEDSQAFNQSIDFINKCTSLENAEQFIDHHIKPQFNWDETSPEVLSLLDLIERRFMKP